MLHACTRRFVQHELMPLERLYANDPDIADDVRAALQAKQLGFWNFDLPQEHALAAQ